MAKQINIIYVEDEPTIAELLVDGLTLFDININAIYASAEELLANIDKPAFTQADVLLFDIRLPRMTGIELATKLREDGEKRPLLLVSAWPSPSEQKLADLRAHFLPKPFDFTQMVQTIQTLAQNES